MLDNPFRARLPKYTDPLLKFYTVLKLTPNQITLAGVLLGFGSAVLVSRQIFLPALLVWWLGRLLDGTDGIYARATGQATALGAHLDILSDMTAYSAMIVGFFFAFPQFTAHWVTILFLYILCITGALSLGSLEEKQKVPGSNNRGLRFAVGVAEGGETGVAYSLFLLFPYFIDYLASVWIALLILTVAARLWLAKNELRI